MKRWNREVRQYEVDYDSDDDPDPMLEHLTGESKEKWDFITTNTRDMRRRNLEAPRIK